MIPILGYAVIKKTIMKLNANDIFKDRPILGDNDELWQVKIIPIKKLVSRPRLISKYNIVD